MATFNNEELTYLAHLSALKLEENEMAPLVEQINSILSYVDQLQNVPLTQKAEPVRNVNIFRDDVAIPTDPAAVLAQAPVLDETYFVVPKILDEK